MAKGYLCPCHPAPSIMSLKGKNKKKGKTIKYSVVHLITPLKTLEGKPYNSHHNANG